MEMRMSRLETVGIIDDSSPGGKEKLSNITCPKGWVLRFIYSTVSNSQIVKVYQALPEGRVRLVNCDNHHGIKIDSLLLGKEDIFELCPNCYELYGGLYI